MRECQSARLMGEPLRGIRMRDEVNFHSKPQSHTWAGYSILAASPIIAIMVAASV
jgi:hypothetical protein